MHHSCRDFNLNTPGNHIMGKRLLQIVNSNFPFLEWKCVCGWVEAFLLHLHKTCQCVFVSRCRFPAELLNYQSLLVPSVCARGYPGIDVCIFVDAIMFLCMRVLLLFSLQPSSELMSKCVVKSASANAQVRMYRTC